MLAAPLLLARLAWSFARHALEHRRMLSWASIGHVAHAWEVGYPFAVARTEPPEHTVCGLKATVPSTVALHDRQAGAPARSDGSPSRRAFLTWRARPRSSQT